MRNISLIAVTLISLFTAGIASGVTLEPKTLARSGEPQSGFTTSAAVRAQADVQVRRLHNLIVNKSGDDANFDKLEKLQKKLRGAK